MSLQGRELEGPSSVRRVRSLQKVKPGNPNFKAPPSRDIIQSSHFSPLSTVFQHVVLSVIANTQSVRTPSPSRFPANSSALRIPFPTPLLASQALQILSPDKELKEQLVARTLAVEGKELCIQFDCVSARMARVAVNSFLESVDLVVSSMAELGELGSV